MSQNASLSSGDADRPRRTAYVVAARSAAVAGVFSLVVAALLLYDLGQRRAVDPQETASYRALKLALSQQPDSESLREQVRTLDLELRQDYFRQRAFTAVGAWLLLGGIGFFLVAAKTAATLRRRLPNPQPQAAPVDRETGWTQTARWSVAGLAVAVLAVAVGLITASRGELPEGSKDLAASLQSSSSDGQTGRAGPGNRDGQPSEPSPPVLHPTDERPLRSDDEIRTTWPRFRGPDGSGISAYANVPDSWDDASGKNIVWKTPVPLSGMNSPVVCGDRVFLSGATKERREVYCFDTATGDLVWQKEVPPNPQAAQMDETKLQYTGFAAPTVAVVGGYVVAIFADGQLAAFDLDGEPAWQRSLGIPDNHYGHASSLAFYRDLVLVQMDQGKKDEPKSKFYAFHVATGEPAWEIDRPVAASWTTPIVVEAAGRPQLVTCAEPWLIAYNPADGTELWRAGCIKGESGPSPVFANGMVYAGNEYCALSAVRADGSGDVTETHVAWTADLGLPDICSPLATADYVFLVVGDTLTCYDAKDGEMLWEEYEAFDYPLFSSSPSLAGGRVYLFGELDKQDEKDAEGNRVRFSKGWVVEPGREGCKIIAENRLEEGCVSSPAFQDGRIYIRGSQHLFCIGEK